MDSLDTVMPLVGSGLVSVECFEAVNALPDSASFGDRQEAIYARLLRAQRAADMEHCASWLEANVTRIIREHGTEATMSLFSTGAVAGLRSVIYDIRALAKEGHGA